MRALDLAWRAFGDWPDPFELARRACCWRASSSRPSCSSRFCLLLEPGRIVALVGNAVAAIELEDPAGDVVEEVAVVGDDDHGARIVAQMLLQPGDALGVEMVGRLVEQQDVGLLAAAACTARRGASRRPTACRPTAVAGRAAQRVHAPARPARRGPRGPWRRSRPAAWSSRRRSRRSSSWRARCSGRGCAFFSATPSMTLPSTSLVGSSCGSCGR